MSKPATDPEREYQLISQLELRIAGASSDEKFESIIQKFLPALILKLSSETARNRDLAIKICQYINQRLKINTTIQLPVQALLGTFRSTHNAFVRNFGLVFVQQGLNRLKADQGLTTLPGVLSSSIPQSNEYDPVDRKMWAIAFDFLLHVLQEWSVPDHDSPEGLALQEKFALSEIQTNALAARIIEFLLFDPTASPSLAVLDEDIRPIMQKYYQKRSAVVGPIAKLIFTSVFSDVQKFIPAVILAVDPNSEASSLSDRIFKQCNFDLEADETVDSLFTLYSRAKPKLQLRILAILSRSKTSTSRKDQILGMVKNQLDRTMSGLEASRLSTAVFSYLTWAVRVSENLQDISPEIQNALKEYIELQGWPAMTNFTTAEAELRAKAYESIGLLAAAQKKTQRPVTDNAVATPVNFELITWLFASLRCDPTREIRASIEESLSRIMNTIVIYDADSARKLKTVLLYNMSAKTGTDDPTYNMPIIHSAKYMTVKFANKCLPFDDVEARFMNLQALMTSERREVEEEGVRGLDPYWHVANLRIVSGGTAVSRKEELKWPKFENLVSKFFGARGTRSLQPDTSDVATSTAAVLFCRNVMVHEALSGTKLATGSEADWKQRIDALMVNDNEARSMLRDYILTIEQETFQEFMIHSLSMFSKGSLQCAEILSEILSLSPDRLVSSICDQGVKFSSSVISNTTVQDRAAKIYGILNSMKASVVADAQNHLHAASTWDRAIGEAAVLVRGHLLFATSSLTRAILRQNINASAAVLDQLASLLVAVTSGSRDKALKDAAYICLGQVALFNAAGASIRSNSETLLQGLIADAKKENEFAVTALGRLVSLLLEASKEDDQSAMLDKLFALHEVRRAEFHFAMGEALAVACAGLKSSSTIAELDIDVKPSDQGYNEQFMNVLLDRIMQDSKTTKPALKKATAIWLLSLVQYCGDLAPIKSRLRDCQVVFARLLTDRDEIVQETGSRGLSLVFEKGDKRLQDDLVRDLVQSFTGSNAKISGTVDEDTQLFETGALPTENGQSVTTYKDIVSLATEMGDPSLVYRFMNLASSNAIWTSRAAFGRFGLGSILADSSYLTENKKFYPKLFRYRFDPNPNVQRSMNEIWKAMVKDSSAVINENFDIIMEDLLKSIVLGKEWRAREASCAAISDLVQGREIEKYEKYLYEIWNVAFKVLDDVKETVRVAAMKLCRTLTAMLIRNLEVGEGSSKKATTMLNHAIPFLLRQMESGAAKEVQQYAVVTLLEIVKKSPLRTLQHFAPQVLETLIVSLSSLEHESINYLHLNADKYGLTAEKLDKMRVSSVNASPLTEAIERCLESVTLTEDAKALDEDDMDLSEGTTSTPMQDAMQRLEAAYKSSIGLPSKVGLSRVMVTLVVRHHAAFRPFADRFARLTRKHILDRNATISVAFSMALGYLMRISSEKEIQATSKYAHKLYFESQELTHRAVAGEIIQAISKTANDVFMNFATVFLPFAFLGRNDTDDQVRERFETPWKDNVGGSRAINLYFRDITELIGNHIKSSLWPIRHACCFTIANVISSMEAQYTYTEAEVKLLWPLVQESLGGKTWEGKEKMIKAFPRFVKQAQPLWPDAPSTKLMQTIVLREAKRTNVSYRPHAILALGEFASVRSDLDLAQEVVPLLTNVVEDLGEDRMEVDTEAGKTQQPSQGSILDRTFTAVVACLFQVLSSDANLQVLDAALAVVQKAHAERSSPIDLALYDGATLFVESVTEKDTVTNGGRSIARDGEQETEENHSRANKVGVESFLEPVVLALLQTESSRQSSESENLRKSRVKLAQTLAEVKISHTTRETLATIFDKWLQTERSRPLRESIEKAKEMNSRSRGPIGLFS